MRNRLKKKLPITVVMGERADETGPANPWSAIAAKVAPSLVGSGAGAVMAWLRRAPGEGLAAE